MKVTVRNGANHGLSRAEVEAMLRHFPWTWSRTVDAIVLYQHQQPDLLCQYYEKERILGLFWPSAEREHPTKVEAVERGSLPTRLGASLRQQYQDDVASVRAKCLEVIGEDAT